MRVISLLMLVTLTGACATRVSSDYDRHRLSRLSEVPGSGSEFIFEAGSVPGVPKDDPAAEAVRMQWLADWMEVRRVCAHGYDVTGRRPFTPGDLNTYQSEFRYVVRCRRAAGQPE